MKTKNKLLAVVGIAIVLCSLLLVAIPAIAAEQTTQKASASEVTTTSEDDFVLGVYGNANEDDTIDMRDLTYVKLIFFGKKPETELADAKYDGKINPLDFIQIKLIIVGKEKEITFEDIYGEAVTVNKPVKRVIVSYRDMVEVLRALNAENEIVGIAEHIQVEKVYFPDISRLPTFGSFWMPDFEAVLNLNTEVFLTFGDAMTLEKKEDFKEKLPSVTIVSLRVSHPETFTENVRKLGYILDRKDEAEEFIDWYEGQINRIKDRTETFSEDMKPRVYMETAKSYTPGWGGSRFDQMIVTAGGINIAADLTGMVKVDPEWVLEQNPDIIVKHASRSFGFSTGYDTDDPSGLIATRDEIMNRPELANVKAVKNGRVYVIDSHHTAGPGCAIGIAYWAMWFYPDLFEDLDPKAIHQEYLTRFQGLDIDLDEKGVFVYPEPS
jgi:iron complex transport system substrate-binding protein